MKNNLFRVLLVLMFAPTIVLAARPSINELNTRVNQLEAENNAQQTEIDDLDARVTALEEVECPSNAPTRFTDNGDGTICDSLTGLMWEMKDASDGAPDLNNPHDVDNSYTWSSTGTAPDGTAFTDFLVRLNSATNNPTVLGFAGYTDWRLPTIVELQTLLFEPFSCSISPCIIDPVFAPTAAAFYWSSTSEAFLLDDAWGVSFRFGRLGGLFKSIEHHVRAVRGGR